MSRLARSLRLPGKAAEESMLFPVFFRGVPEIIRFVILSVMLFAGVCLFEADFFSSFKPSPRRAGVFGG